MKTNKLHYFSGIVISIFVFLHLFNHLCSIFGAEKHIEMMNWLRLFYRNPIAETLLLLAISGQIYSGISLFLKKRKIVKMLFEKIQIWSGLYLAMFLLIHLSAILIGRAILQLDTNFYFGVAGINTFPFCLFFVPYYALAIMAFFGHIAAVHHQKMKNQVLGISVKNQAKSIVLIGIVITFIVFLGLTNHFYGVEIPETYHILIGK